MKNSKLTYEEKKAKRRGEFLLGDDKDKCNDIRSYVRNFRNKKRKEK